MPVYPGDPAVTIAPALTVAADGVAVARLDLGSHAGTHLDAPVHVIPGGRTVEEIPLARLWGEAFVARIDAAVPDTAIVAADASTLPTALPQIVCIDTGWDVHFGTDAALATRTLRSSLPSCCGSAVLACCAWTR
nr:MULTISPECIES: cyclase family protein [unclassified Leucobacter]